MAPRDFENLERLKLVIPAFELFTIVGTFVGPLVAPALWLRFVALFIAVFVLASACQARRMAAFVLKLRRTLRRYEGTEGVMSMEGGGGVEGGEKASAALFGGEGGGDSAQKTKKPKVSSSSSSAKIIIEDDDDVGASDSTPLRLGVVVGGESDSAAAARSANPASTSTSSNSADSVAVDVGGFVHAFVIPNYQEPLHVLRSTLARLAAHRGASARYLVTLAMEEGERGAAAKAAELVAEFGSGTASSSSSGSSSSSSFLDLSWTLHPRGLPGESPGKASNANHGARAAVERAASLGFPAARVMVTCMDADAHVPPLYVALVDAAAAAADDPHARVYAAPIVFERNAAAVPALTRVHDAMWSAMAAQNLGSSMGLGFPISNYTMSASLLRAVDFWDLHDDAIGEDLHMFLKAYFKTGGKVRLCAIAAPLNMLNLQAESYAATLWARAVQAERHARGVADFSYAVNQCLLARAEGTKLPKLHTAVLLLKLAEAQALPATAPFYMGIAGAWAMILSKVGVIAPLSAPALAAFRLAGYLGAAGALGFACMAALNEVMRATVRPALFGLPVRGPGAESRARRALEYPVLIVGMWLFMVFPSLHAAATSALAALSNGRFKQSGYVVAEKLVATSPRGGDSNGSSSNGFGSSLELASAGGGAAASSSPPPRPSNAPLSSLSSSSPAKQQGQQQHSSGAKPPPSSVRHEQQLAGKKWGGVPGVGAPAVAATAV